MTEQEYQDLLERAAEEFKDEKYPGHRRSPDHYSHTRHDFKAGNEWTRRNPPPNWVTVESVAEELFKAKLAYEYWLVKSGESVLAGFDQEALAQFAAARSEK